MFKNSELSECQVSPYIAAQDYSTHEPCHIIMITRIMFIHIER